jgi:predicted RNA binding protein YcfA (HicA-like mRNA interferase family)
MSLWTSNPTVVGEFKIAPGTLNSILKQSGLKEQH